MVQLDSLLGDVDSRKPPAYLSPRIQRLIYPMLSLHDELSHSMYGFSECEQTLIPGCANIVSKRKTGEKHYLNRPSLKAIWQVELNSPSQRDCF